MSATLIVFKPDGSKVDVPLKSGKYLVGRTSSARLRVPLPNVSRRHCEFIVEDSSVRLRDLHSSNGTFQNGNRCMPDDEVPLNAGDYIGIGSCQMGVQINGEPEEMEAPKGPAPSLKSQAAAPTPPPPKPAPDPSDDSNFDSRFDGEDTEDLDTTIQTGGSVSTDDLLAELDDGSSEFDFNFDMDDDNEDEESKD